MAYYTIPNAAIALGSVQLLYNSLNQACLKIFTNNPGPSDLTNYPDYVNIGSGNVNQSVLTMIADLEAQLSTLKVYAPLGVASPGITVTGTTAVFTTAVPHNYQAGNKVVISSSSQAGLNTAANTTTVVGISSLTATTFSYTVANGTLSDGGLTASVQCFSLS